MAITEVFGCSKVCGLRVIRMLRGLHIGAKKTMAVDLWHRHGPGRERSPATGRGVPRGSG